MKGVLDNYKMETTIRNKTEINRKLIGNETEIKQKKSETKQKLDKNKTYIEIYDIIIYRKVGRCNEEK